MPKGGPYYVKKGGQRCRRCNEIMPIGTQYTWDREHGGLIHPTCKDRRPSASADLASTDGQVASTDAQAPTGNGEVAAQGGPSALAQALLDEILPYLPTPEELVSEEKVRQIVEALIRERIESPTVVTMPGQFSVELPKVRHALFEKLLYLIGKKKNVLLTGPSQAGKTKAAQMIAEALGRRYGEISLNPQTPDSRLFGNPTANGGYNPTVFYEIWKDGGVFCIDEIDNSSASTMTTLNSAFSNSHCAFPCGMVERHPDTVIIATANTVGRGPTKEFPDRRPLDGATMQRFYMLHWGYDDNLETALVTAINAKDAERILSWIRLVRHRAKEKGIQVMATPTAAMLMAEFYLDGVLTPEEIADGTVWKGLPDAQRDSLGVPRSPEV